LENEDARHQRFTLHTEKTVKHLPPRRGLVAKKMSAIDIPFAAKLLRCQYYCDYLVNAILGFVWAVAIVVC